MQEILRAVAVSWYRSEYTNRAADMLIKAGVKTNIHYVLSKNTVEEAIERLSRGTFPNGINAVVFLLHKPVGLGSQQNVIITEHKAFWSLLKQINSKGCRYKIGFDSCSVPALINNRENIDLDSLDTCEGARWSAYISPDMKMMPCSFDNQEMRWAVDLRCHTIEEAWKSREFENFRESFYSACPNCAVRTDCMGGCPIRPEIVLCDKKH